jgi:hypothetical protein
MYYEEKWIDGWLWYRRTLDGPWLKASEDQMIARMRNALELVLPPEVIRIRGRNSRAPSTRAWQAHGNFVLLSPTLCRKAPVHHLSRQSPASNVRLQPCRPVPHKAKKPLRVGQKVYRKIARHPRNGYFILRHGANPALVKFTAEQIYLKDMQLNSRLGLGLERDGRGRDRSAATPARVGHRRVARRAAGGATAIPLT